MLQRCYQIGYNLKRDVAPLIFQISILLSYSKNWKSSAFAVYGIQQYSNFGHITTTTTTTTYRHRSPTATRHNDIHTFRRTELPVAMIHNNNDNNAENKKKDDQSSVMVDPIINAPIARRDEKSHVFAGNDPNTNGNVLRQSMNSENPLVNPAFPIPSPYQWMRDESRTNKEVLEHLKLENDYTQSLTNHLNSFRDKIYDEMISTLQETDFTVPISRGSNYLYYSRSMEGMSYPIYCRAPASIEMKDDIYLASILKEWDGSKETNILEGEEKYLDVNELAKGHDYCSTGSVSISPSHNKLAYTLDVIGGETYNLFVTDLDSGKNLYENSEEEMDSTVVWGKDDSTIYYLTLDDAHRPYQVYKKTLNNNDEDELLFEENDELFWVHIYKSQDDKYLFISSESSETSEIHYISMENNSPNADDNKTEIHVIAPRRAKVLYDVEHHHNHFYVRTRTLLSQMRMFSLWHVISWSFHISHYYIFFFLLMNPKITSNVGGTPNMRLMKSPVQPHCQDLWQDVIWNDSPLFTGDYERSIDSITPFTNHLVVEGRQNSLPQIWILSLKDDHIVTSFKTLKFPDEANAAGLGPNYIYDTDHVLISYDSLVTPDQYIQIGMDDPNNNANRIVLKQKNVPGYNPDLYSCERTTVRSRDGETLIPVSLVYRKDVFDKNIPVPTHLYGYGSYGSCIEADFSASRLPLLNRGMVYVIAHVRGGGEMGRQWYEEPNGGKYLCKKNTFQDFVDVAEWLIHDSGKGITTPKMLSCEGR